MVSVRDIIIIAVILLAVGIATTVIVYMSHTIVGELKAAPLINETTQAVEVLEVGDDVINYSDYIYFAGFIAFFIAICITGYFSATHPVFSVIYFIIVILFTFFSVILQYVWNTLGTSTFFVTGVIDVPITNFILSHLAYFMAVFGLVGLLLMFAKNSEGNNYVG